MRRWFTDNKLIRIVLDHRYRRTCMYIGVFSNHGFEHSSASDVLDFSFILLESINETLITIKRNKSGLNSVQRGSLMYMNFLLTIQSN